MPGAARYLTALEAMAGDHPLALGMAGVVYGRIPFLVIERYAARAGIDDINDFDRFRRIVVALDTEETNLLNAKANKPA